ncbi:MAG TPA: YggS family pyridoxal phosphate-dependent enzyme [Bacteroidales bacterium]|nr:YggS family pyridoxal phosphate-dependent enzyme [Bacteroidales bacterium]
MSAIGENIISLKRELPSGVKLVAVSKTKPVSDILQAYNAGQRIFGENRVGELLLKKDQLPEDIEWHMIGHLQTNKVKSIITSVSLIHSVDTFKLLRTINDEALKMNRLVNCLLQFHIATEETKFGFSIEEALNMTDSEEFSHLKSVRICGVMGMATFTDDKNLVSSEFRSLAGFFRLLREGFYQNSPEFCEISMGMSGDFRTAIGEGSTLVRIGSLIFGERK